MTDDGFRSSVTPRARGVPLAVVLAIAVLPVLARAADSLPSWTDGAGKARIVGFVEAEQTAPCGAVARDGAGRPGAQ